MTLVVSSPPTTEELAHRVGERIRAHLDRTGMPIVGFAAQVGLDRKTVGAMMRGLHCPRLGTVYLIALALDTTIDDLVDPNGGGEW